MSKAYIGIRKCGCVTRVCVDDKRFAKETAEFITECVRDGLSVEHVDLEDVRGRIGRCKHLTVQMELEDKP